MGRRSQSILAPHVGRGSLLQLEAVQHGQLQREAAEEQQQRGRHGQGQQETRFSYGGAPAVMQGTDSHGG